MFAMSDHNELGKLTKALDEIDAYNFYNHRRNFLSPVEKERFELLKNNFKENYDYVNAYVALLAPE